MTAKRILLAGSVTGLLVLPALGTIETATGVGGSSDIATSAAWKQFRGGPRHHGGSQDETMLSPATVPGLTKLWSHPMAEGVFSSAAVVGRRVFVGALNGRMYALDRRDGHELWNYPHDAIDGDTVWTSPAVHQGLVYFAANRPFGVVYAVDAVTGAQVWSRSYTDIVISSPVLADGQVTFAFNDGSLRALDAATGVDVWTYDGSSGAYSSPAVAGNRMYIAIHNRGLLSLDARTGRERWLAPMPGPQWSSPAVADGRVFVGSRDDQKVYAFDALTGALLWTKATTGWVHSSPAVTDGTVFIGNENGDLYSLDAATGAQNWRTRLDAGLFAGPTVANGVVYATTGLGDGKLVALDQSDGQVLFSDFVGDGDQSGDGEWVQASPSISGGVVYIASYESDAMMTAFGLPTPPIR